MFVWIVADLHRVTGLDPSRIYPTVNFVSLTGTAMLLYVIGLEGFALSTPTAVFSALWFLMLSPVGVIYETQAHPDGIGILLMSASVLAFAKRRYTLSAVLLAVSILAKESGYFLLVYFGLRLVLSPDAAEKRLRVSILTSYVLVAGAAVLARYLYAIEAGLPNAAPVDSILGISDHVRGRGLIFPILNFEVLWIPFALELWSIARRRAPQSEVVLWYLTFTLATLLLTTDWYRVMFAPLFFLVIPLSARAMERRIEGGPGAALSVIGFLLTTLLLVKKGPFEDWEALPLPKYFAMMTFVLVGTVLARRATSDVSGAEDLTRGRLG